MKPAKALLLLALCSPAAHAAGGQMVVSAQVQANRDNTRKAILIEEYNSEQRELQRKQAMLQKATPEQAADLKSQVRNHQANMAAIQTELSRVGRTNYVVQPRKPVVATAAAPKPAVSDGSQLAQDVHSVANDPGVPNEYDAFGGI